MPVREACDAFLADVEGAAPLRVESQEVQGSPDQYPQT